MSELPTGVRVHGLPGWPTFEIAASGVRHIGEGEVTVGKTVGAQTYLSIEAREAGFGKYDDEVEEHCEGATLWLSAEQVRGVIAALQSALDSWAGAS